MCICYCVHAWKEACRSGLDVAAFVQLEKGEKAAGPQQPLPLGS